MLLSYHLFNLSWNHNACLHAKGTELIKMVFCLPEGTLFMELTRATLKIHHSLLVIASVVKYKDTVQDDLIVLML
jgi:hypothetical protein